LERIGDHAHSDLRRTRQASNLVVECNEFVRQLAHFGESAFCNLSLAISHIDGYAIICVLSITRAVLDTVTAEIVRNTLFEQWLEKRWQRAAIEWLYQEFGISDLMRSSA